MVVGQLTTSRIRSDYNNELARRGRPPARRAAPGHQLADGADRLRPPRPEPVQRVEQRHDPHARQRRHAARARTGPRRNLGCPLPPVTATEHPGLPRRDAPHVPLRAGIGVRRRHPVRAQGLRPREHREARALLPGLRRLRRHAARAARRRSRSRRRAMRADRRAHRRRARIERTRDPDVRVPQPQADDEVAELARTLEEMLQRWPHRARRARLRSRASASSSPTPRTSCARR